MGIGLEGDTLGMDAADKPVEINGKDAGNYDYSGFNGNVPISSQDIKLAIPTANGSAAVNAASPRVSPEEEEPQWAELSCTGRLKRLFVAIWKSLALLVLLYFFICSLDFLSTSFRLLAGKAAGEIFQNELLQNPVVGVMIGVLATVLVQSSSTATSVVVSMVAAGSLQVGQAIPIIMGSNIGTSVTNTIVSLTQVADRDDFERAFAGATVHDMFNWLAVITLLIIEVSTGYLEHVTGLVVSSMTLETSKGKSIELLRTITKPFTDCIIQIDKKVLEGWSLNDTRYENATLIKQCGESRIFLDDTLNATLTNNSQMADFSFLNETQLSEPAQHEGCNFLLSGLSFIGDVYVGLILLLLSLMMLSGCLILMVKILHSVLRGHMAVVIQRTINADIPYVPCLTGYLAIMVGCVMTILVQSSSVFTSAITPLVGVGVISLERAYPLTLGSNIGTTTTALLASLTAEGDKLRPSIQIALCHFFFNVTAIAIFYPIPFMRWPISLARLLGHTTAKYRWFAMLYLAMMFFILPLAVFGLSMAGRLVFYCMGAPFLALAVAVAVVNVLQMKKPELLPLKMRTWDWLPLPLRSLQPLDRLVTKAASICCCRRMPLSPNRETMPLRNVFPSKLSELGLDNPSFHGATKV